MALLSAATLACMVTRAFAARSSGSSRAVRAKGPRWLTASWSSNPSTDVCRVGGVITPALLISRWIGWPSASSVSARRATDASEARSSSPTATSAAGTAARMRAVAASPLAAERTGSSTSAPARARRSAIATPMPSLAPVTTARLPLRSGTSMSARVRGSVAVGMPPTVTPGWARLKGSPNLGPAVPVCGSGARGLVGEALGADDRQEPQLVGVRGPRCGRVHHQHLALVGGDEVLAVQGDRTHARVQQALVVAQPDGHLVRVPQRSELGAVGAQARHEFGARDVVGITRQSGPGVRDVRAADVVAVGRRVAGALLRISEPAVQQAAPHASVPGLVAE